MKKSIIALAALLFSQPVFSAETITVEISGSAAGTEFFEYSLVDPALWPAECAGNNPFTEGCQVTRLVTLSPFSSIVEARSTDGIIFTFGDFLNLGPIDRRGYNGSARRISDGVFAPINLSIEETSIPNPNDSFFIPQIIRTASTNSFTVTQLFPVPVPEPATWMLMLLGFFGIGAVMRDEKALQRDRSQAF